MSDHRTKPRQRVYKGATILFGGVAIDCIIKNVSPIGAGLEVSSQIGIPHEFDLVRITDQVRTPCRVVWRTTNRVGVAFSS
jgi:hypothetical protein